jgi:hypothetical protein
MLPKYEKKGVNLPLFAQGRGEHLDLGLRDGQFKEVGLFPVS